MPRYSSLKIFLFLFFIFSILSLSKNSILAAAGPAPVCLSPPLCRGPWIEYKCSANCDGEIQKRNCQENLVTVGSSGGCPIYACPPSCDSSWTAEGTKGQLWQKCSSYPNITETKPSFACSGQCLEAPQNPRYYDNPTYLNQADKSKGRNNVFLPVKLDWDNVAGWYKKDYLTPLPTYILAQLPEEIYEDVPKPPTPPPAEATPPPAPLPEEISSPIPIFFQNYPRGPDSWFNFALSKIETIGRYGCNLTSFAMTAKYFGCEVTPLDIGKFVKEKNFWNEGIGISNATLFYLFSQQCPKYYWGKFYNFDEVAEKIKEGKIVIAGFSNYLSKDFQHWIVIRGLTKNNEFIVNNPAYGMYQKERGVISKNVLESYKPKAFYWFEKKTEETAKKYESYAYLNDIRNIISEETAEIENKIFYTKSGPDPIEAPSSYRITIENTNLGTYEEILDNSEYIPPICLLKSNTTHNWQVKACCGADGTNCQEDSGKQLRESFTTNLAPEPISPVDPDWTGPEKIENVKIPVTLDWCDVDQAESYLLKSYKLKNGEEVCHEWLRSKENGKEICLSYLIAPEERETEEKEILHSDYIDSYLGFFTKDTTYIWQMSTCKTEYGTNCSDYGQKWGFKTEDVKLSPPNLTYPPDDPSGNIQVELPITLKWDRVFGAHSYYYQIGAITGTVIDTQTPVDYPTLDTPYAWKVRACWDEEGKKCDDWSKEWHFKTTGAAPKLTYPPNNASDIPVPVELDWKSISGSKSYKYQISTDINFNNIVNKGTIIPSQVSIDYPNLKMLTGYWWQVRTCADGEGKVCGEWSQTQSFTTFKLAAPSNPSPQDKEKLFTYQMPRNISWAEVPYAKSYKYTLSYISKASEEAGDCPTGIVGEKIVSGLSTFISLNCLGEYEWQVSACLDKKCQEIGDPSLAWRFTLSQPKEVKKGGLVPCGREYDIPPEITPWNEREPCQIKHIFIMLKTIIDFLLWSLMPLILVLLVLATGAIFYFFSWDPNVLNLIKSIWKGVGIGIGVMFLAWTIITIFMSFLGYRIGIYGPWWQIKF